MLEVNGLTKSFGSLDVLKGVNMQVEKGEMVALMGPSGSGKSTLLNIIGGLLAGDGGSITLDERTYGQKGPSSVVDVRRNKVGWIFQDFHLRQPFCSRQCCHCSRIVRGSFERSRRCS